MCHFVLRHADCLANAAVEGELLQCFFRGRNASICLLVKHDLVSELSSSHVGLPSLRWQDQCSRKHPCNRGFIWRRIPQLPSHLSMGLCYFGDRMDHKWIQVLHRCLFVAGICLRLEASKSWCCSFSKRENRWSKNPFKYRSSCRSSFLTHFFRKQRHIFFANNNNNPTTLPFLKHITIYIITYFNKSYKSASNHRP